MQSSTGSKFGAFLDTYNQGSTMLQSAADTFIARTEVDRKTILARCSPGLMQDKIGSLSKLLDDKSRSSYDRLLMAGNILADVSKEIIDSTNTELKQSGSNLIRSFFETAKQTEDQQLLNTAQQIAMAIG